MVLLHKFFFSRFSLSFILLLYTTGDAGHIKKMNKLKKKIAIWIARRKMIFTSNANCSWEIYVYLQNLLKKYIFKNIFNEMKILINQWQCFELQRAYIFFFLLSTTQWKAINFNILIINRRNSFIFKNNHLFAMQLFLIIKFVGGIIL